MKFSSLQDYYKHYKTLSDLPGETNPLYLKNVYLNISTGIILDRWGTIIAESSIGPGRIRRSGLLGVKKPSKMKVLGSGSTIYCKSAKSGYYHWLVECLPRLIELSKTEKDCTIYLPQLNGIYKQALQIIMPENIKVVHTNDEWIFFEEFTLIPFYAKPGKGFISKSFRTYLFEKLHLKGVDSSVNKIFFSRRNAQKRKIINEDQFFKKYLEPKNFKRINLEDFQFTEQLRIINDSCVVIAPHGAGLSNLIGANKDCKVIEIISTDQRPMRFFSSLCQSIGLDYLQYTIKNKVGRHDDYTITDTDALEIVGLL